MEVHTAAQYFWNGLYLWEDQQMVINVSYITIWSIVHKLWEYLVDIPT